MKKAITLFFVLLSTCTAAQPLFRKALFLGNSYTYVNDLPLLTAGLAYGSGDSLFFDSYTPGGYTLGWQPTAHATDPVSLAKIAGNSWDFVVLQEQSQTPSIYKLRDSCMIPASIVLHDSVKSVNPCARVLFYLTWGRRFGGMQCFTPNYCSFPFSGFNQMQDTLTRSYKMVADSLGDWIAPVGEAWRLAINNTGMVLHSDDFSHPNLKGSYLAACVFYNVIFGKSSAGNPFLAGLPADTALMLQQAADSVTLGYASLWNLNNDLPEAGFETAVNGNTLVTDNVSTNATQWRWDFGDGQSSTQFEPSHIYASGGDYTVKLRACNSCFCDSVEHVIHIVLSGNHTSPTNPEIIMITGPDDLGYVTFSNYNANGRFLLYNMVGKLVSDVPVINGISVVSDLSKGLYLWRLSDDSGQEVHRGKLLVSFRHSAR
jgi:hypothetical protein